MRLVSTLSSMKAARGAAGKLRIVDAIPVAGTAQHASGCRLPRVPPRAEPERRGARRERNHRAYVQRLPVLGSRAALAGRRWSRIRSRNAPTRPALRVNRNQSVAALAIL